MAVIKTIIEDIIKIRNYTFIEEREKDWGIEIIAKTEKGEDVIIWGVEKVKIIGVKWIRDLKKKMEKDNFSVGIIVGGSKATKSATLEADRYGIGVITRELPLMPLIKHEFVPEHKIATKEEVEELKRKYGISLLQLPLILSKDPMVKAIGAKKGDVIKIIRKSPIAGETIYYRYVV